MALPNAPTSCHVGPSAASAKAKIAIIAALLAMLTQPALACALDTDCSPGSKCMKPPGRVIGMCAGGLFPGNRYDQKPYSDPFDPNGTAGKTCSYGIDCGPGSHCAMGSGTFGVCQRGQ